MAWCCDDSERTPLSSSWLWMNVAKKNVDLGRLQGHPSNILKGVNIGVKQIFQLSLWFT